MRARTQHTPLRSCVVCGRKTGKSDLLRIVRRLKGPWRSTRRASWPVAALMSVPTADAPASP